MLKQKLFTGRNLKIDQIIRKLIKKAGTLKNRGQIHLFLGNPLSDGCDKTTVEPGNSYSPGVWTCGISLWIELSENLYSPDLIRNDVIQWELNPPVIKSKYTIKNAITITHHLTHLGGEGAEGVDFNQIQFAALKDCNLRTFIVIKDIGPAGGKIKSLSWSKKENLLLINKALKLIPETPVNNCYIMQSKNESDSSMAIIESKFHLKKKQEAKLLFKTIHGFSDRHFTQYLPLNHPHDSLSVEKGFDLSIKNWEKELPARIISPDENLNQTWQRCAYHILAAMECGNPIISAVNYPVWWIRDGVIITRALDYIGRHDLARISNDTLSYTYFSGGFGAESDSLSQGIWCLASHAEITKDKKWLKKIYPHIQNRIEFLDQMLSAAQPIRIPGPNRAPHIVNSPGANILCLPAKNGLINGRMDWHSPNFYINCWAYAGYKKAAQAARMLGNTNDARKWDGIAESLDNKIYTHLLPELNNPRDLIVTPYPTQALNSHLTKFAQKFRNWFMTNRLTSKHKRKPELLWTYFEAAQIHNAFLLNMKNEAWICLKEMIQPIGTWDASIHTEGSPDGEENLPFRNDHEKKGWLNKNKAPGGNMPHNWTSAELINCIRDIFVNDDGNKLLIGKSIPDEWFKPGNIFGVKNMPTKFGNVSYKITVNKKGKGILDYNGPKSFQTDLNIKKYLD